MKLTYVTLSQTLADESLSFRYATISDANPVPVIVIICPPYETFDDGVSPV